MRGRSAPRLPHPQQTRGFPGPLTALGHIGTGARPPALIFMKVIKENAMIHPIASPGPDKPKPGNPGPLNPGRPDPTPQEIPTDLPPYTVPEPPSEIPNDLPEEAPPREVPGAPA